MDYAMRQGCDYALLMDQDSSLHQESIELLRRALEENERAFIAAPMREDSDLARLPAFREDYTRRLTCISSGSLVNLKYVKNVGLHDERLFIDLVDHEYCLRANRKGYQIVIANRARMRHRLGRMEERRFLGMRFYPTHHSPLRKYYKARNSLYVWTRYFFRYPRYVLPGIGTFIKEYLETLLFEEDKMKKTRAILAGMVDFFAGRFGECNRPELTGEGAR
jgi:rhamnosyltransferase